MWLCKRRCAHAVAALVRGECSSVMSVIYRPLQGKQGSETRVWTDPTDGPVGFITQRASDNLLAVGSGTDVFLVHYRMGNSKASWVTKLTVPPPPKRPLSNDQGSVSTARARSAHFLTRNTHLIVTYAGRGVVCVSASASTNVSDELHPAAGTPRIWPRYGR